MGAVPMNTNHEKVPPRNIFSKMTWAMLALLFGTCIVLVILLQSKEVTDLDVWLFHEVREQYETSLKAFVRVFTDIGSPLVWLLVVPILWLIRKKEAAWALFIAVLMAVVIAGSLKYAIDRPRPFDIIQMVDPLYRPIDPSFPSAHAMTAFAAAVTIGKKWRKALIPLLALAAAVGYSRVYIGVHFPYDVAGGALIGILIGLVVDTLNLTRMIDWTEIRIHRVAKRLGVSREEKSSSVADSQDEI
jgi:undecaprenyl-diphosphatase